MDDFNQFSINLNGRLVVFDRPAVMGIVNATPDSFYESSRGDGADAVASMVEMMIADGADIIDIGGCSTRPGSTPPDESIERQRVVEAVKAARGVSPDAIISVDTYRAAVAQAAIEAGADMVNDISGGDLDEAMFDTVARLRVPYVLTHSRGVPADMSTLTSYPDGVVTDVLSQLSAKISRLALLGVADVIVDPGFGFAKTPEQGFELLAYLPVIARYLERPILVGLSRKSMVCKPLAIEPRDALAPTVAANTLALAAGAAIVRVHDVKAAVEAREIVERTRKGGRQ